MAVAFDAVGPSSSGARGAAVATLSWTHTNVGSGAALAAGGGVDFTAGNGPATVTCNLDPAGANTAFPLSSSVHNNNSNSGDTWLFGLANTSSGAHTVKVTTTGTVPAVLIFGSQSYTGADTVSAFGTPVTAFGNSTAPAATLTGTTSGNMCAGVASIGSSTLSNPATSRWLDNTGGSGAAGNAGGADKAAGGSVTFTWSDTTTDWWGAIAVEVLAPAAAGGGGGAAQPGRTWARQFKHRQRLPELIAPDPPPDQTVHRAQPGQTWARQFQHRQVPPQPSGPVAAPQAGPPVYPLLGPVGLGQRAPGPFVKGRASSRAGVYSQAGPPVYPLRGPVTGQGRGLPSRGRTQHLGGVYGQPGPRVYPLRGPVAGQGRGLPPRGRAAANRGTYAQAGPPVTPLRGPVTSQGRGLPPRGRCAGSAGTFTAVAVPVPPAYLQPGQTWARQFRHRQALPVPPPPAAGAPVSGPPVYPLRGPVQAKAPLPPRGTAAGTVVFLVTVPMFPVAPVYPLQRPVASQGRGLPPRGRCAGNRGVRHQTGRPAQPLRGPVAPFRPGPYRAGRCAFSRGTYGQPGPPFYPLRKPARSRIPHRPRGGRTAGNPGAPVFVPPFTIGTLTALDTARNTLTAAGSAAVLTAATTAGATATGTAARLFPSTAGPASSAPFGGTIVEGVLFKTTISGMTLRGYWFWRADTAQPASASFALWQATGFGTGTLVASSAASTATMTAGQWNYVPLPAAIPLTAGTTYKAQAGVTGNFPDTHGQFSGGGPYQAGIVNGPLTAFSNLAGAGGTNPDPFGDFQCTFDTSTANPAAVYATSTDGTGYNAWIDVQVDSSAVTLTAATSAGTLGASDTRTGGPGG